MSGTRAGARLVCFGLALAACTTADVGETTTAPIENTSPGRIVVLDADGDIVTLDPDGANRVAITADGDTATYFQPVWSPESSTIAWSVSDAEGFAVGFARDDGSERERVDVPGFPFYVNWSPDGEQIGLLHGGSGGTFDFELVDMVAGRSSALDSGSPYYFSWSPEGDALVVHVGGDRLEIFDESATPTDIGPTSPRFFAPRWAPPGIFYLSPDGITLRTNEGDRRVLSQAAGFVSINPNPRGSLVAVHSLSSLGGITVGLAVTPVEEGNTVSVIDVDSGDVEVVSDTLSIGSFWSPNGARLLILEVNADARAVDVVIWEEGEKRVLTTMGLPDSLITEALAFFDQYAQSWRPWNPGSDAIVLPGTIGEAEGVWVVPVDGTDPLNVSDGDWASWSYGH
ncbi:MAG: hypothetical protein WDZ96_03125 [Acidimicrobiia bacterium]